MNDDRLIFVEVQQRDKRLDPLFPAAKIGWLLEAYPEARSLSDRGDLCAGTIDSWLLFKLTGGAIHSTDASNASRTQLFDIHQQDWSDELCTLFGVPKSILPRVEDSNARFGAAKTVHRLIEGVPVHTMMGTLTRRCSATEYGRLERSKRLMEPALRL